MGALQDFVRRYGGVMTAYIFAGCGIWMIGMIVLPQLLMLEKSLTYSDPAASAQVAQIQARTDELFVQITRAERDIARLQDRLSAIEAGEPDPAAEAGATTLLNPFASPGQAESTAAATPEELRAEIETLQTRIAEARAQIAANDAELADTQAAAQPQDRKSVV